MILDWIVANLIGERDGDLGGLLGQLVNALPDAADLGIGNTDGIFPYFSLMNQAVPLDTVVQFFGLYVTVAVSVVVFRGIITAWAQVPVIGGHG